MKISEAGVNFIKSFEDFRADAYFCQAKKLTIGYGHVILPGESFTKVTEQEASSLLKKDCAKALNAIEKLVKVELNQNQIDALTSLVFNIGVHAFSESTLLRLLNSGEYAGAANEFPRWNKVRIPPLGELVESNGLITRRQLEKCLFLSP